MTTTENPQMIFTGGQMRIHIICASGSGKTHFAKALSEKYYIPHYDLDSLFWDNTAEQYGVKTPPAKRDALLSEIVRQPDWIVEGVYCSWVEESLIRADAIVVLDLSLATCNVRIIRRFIGRKLGMQAGKKETVRSLVRLLQWNRRFHKDKHGKMAAALSGYAEKTVYLHTAK